MATFDPSVSFFFASRVIGLNWMVGVPEGHDDALSGDTPMFMPNMYENGGERLDLGDQWFLTETDMAPYYYIHSTAYGAGYAFTVWVFDATDQSYINLNKTGGNKGGNARSCRWGRRGG